MAVFRVEKNHNYTVMSNHHLQNCEFSLKSKGLFAQMFSLPDNWDYTLAGLAKINREKVDAIRTAIWELKKFGYITRRQTRDPNGRMSKTEYIIYEYPQEVPSPILENPILENPITVKPTSENSASDNPMQLNTNSDCMKKNTTDVRNIKKYLLAVLFNAPSTMDSGVAFNETTDILADGKMTVEKSKNFADITLQGLKFYKENGKYYVSGTFPELPDGFENWMTIDIERNDDQPVISFTTGFKMIEEQKILPNGTFIREISIHSPNKINYIHIKIGVEATENLKTNFKSSYYNILSNKQNEVTCIVSDSSETNKKIQYDFSQLFTW